MKEITIDDKNRLDALKKKAARQGLRLATTAWRYYTVDNDGGGMLIESFTNTVVQGDRFSLDLSDIELWLNKYEMQRRA